MIVYNRRKRAIYFAAQERDQALVLASAREAVAAGTASPAQTALVVGIAEEEEAMEKKKAERKAPSKLLWWLHGDWKEEKLLEQEQQQQQQLQLRPLVSPPPPPPLPPLPPRLRCLPLLLSPSARRAPSVTSTWT